MKRKDYIRQIGDLKVALLDASKQINELERENRRLTERQKNCDKNRRWCDDASNYLGPWAKSRLRNLDQVLATVQTLRAELTEIDDAYHTVDGTYPWDNEDN